MIGLGPIAAVEGSQRAARPRLTERHVLAIGLALSGLFVVAATAVAAAPRAALRALGLNSFPGFVRGRDGTITQRLTGEIGVDQFAQILTSLAP